MTIIEKDLFWVEFVIDDWNLGWFLELLDNEGIVVERQIKLDNKYQIMVKTENYGSILFISSLYLNKQDNRQQVIKQLNKLLTQG